MKRLTDTCSRARAAGRKLLIPYIVAGDPNLTASLALMHALVQQGADIIELGIPFSDPSSDGPVIQKGVERALKAGTSLTRVLQLVADFRRDDTATPVVLMGYLNPIESMGYAAFADRAATAGVDGVLTVDMPPAESSELHGLLRAAGLDTIFLVAPTTRPQRVRDIIEHSSGYLYYVSLKGVTGAALTEPETIAARITELRADTDLPIVIGFGIKDADSAAAMGRCADGVVIGSALVEGIGSLAADATPAAGTLEKLTAVIGLARQALDELE